MYMHTRALWDFLLFLTRCDHEWVCPVVLFSGLVLYWPHASSGGYWEGERLGRLFAEAASESGVRGLGLGRVHSMPPCMESPPDLSVPN